MEARAPAKTWAPPACCLCVTGGGGEVPSFLLLLAALADGYELTNLSLSCKGGPVVGGFLTGIPDPGRSSGPARTHLQAWGYGGVLGPPIPLGSRGSISNWRCLGGGQFCLVLGVIPGDPVQTRLLGPSNNARAPHVLWKTSAQLNLQSGFRFQKQPVTFSLLDPLKLQLQYTQIKTA